MPEFSNDGVADAEFEQMLYDLRRQIPDRFVITHFDASMFVDELMEAALALRLNFIEADGVPVAFGTNDPDKVAAYRVRMDGWGWQIFDSVDGSFTEADEAA